MITIRKSHERGHIDHGWLDTYHTFSFDQYYDPRWMGFQDLRVINEDKVAGHNGFPVHSHREIEIITYIMEGALAHKDSMGNGSIIRAGDVQRMTAGTGVSHSEANPADETVHLLQIWILPDTRGLKPGYEQKAFAPEEKLDRLRLVASQTGHDGSVTINQDANVYASVLESGQSVTHELAPGRHAWIQVARGSVNLSGKVLDQGDGAAVSAESSISLAGVSLAELLLFDLA